MKFLDRDHPFFASPVRRWVTVILPLCWAGVELWMGSPGWAVLFAAAGAFAAWELFIRP